MATTHAENREPIRPHAADPEFNAHALRILDALRGFGADYTEITRQFAAHLGLHSTDAAAIVEILYAEDNGQLLSPKELGERLGLTSGATTNLLNRLERQGHIERLRIHVDRRKVTIRMSDAIEEPAREFFGAFSSQMEELVSVYEPEELERFEGFLLGLRRILHGL
ncbi:MarR family transcriptional regulator [Kibdelosporangium philippinense]|uniref:MarR family transcriptional regulator n=1 Tax=Kibdelosporangium philippinense TaxID=211113 RepID=A0ABS8ZKB4_9PSEU|nr:MarR family transcriptional regulator [Kibdelosporangium philippinense]MCE7007405.1 MarR family transcriptional regulator [Kibdelosporangium philippinense]